MNQAACAWRLRTKGNYPGRQRLGTANAKALLDRLQFLAGLESHGLARRNRNLRAGARVTTNSSFARPNVEYAKSPQLNAVALGQRTLHAFKHRLYGHFGFGLGDAGPVDNFVDDVELDHRGSSPRKISVRRNLQMLWDL